MGSEQVFTPPSSGTCDGNLVHAGGHADAPELPFDRRVTAGRPSAGGWGRGAPPNDKIDYRVFEIFSPPYLFKGARPVITDAPTSVTYGDTFFRGNSACYGHQQGELIRLSSVTHAFNQNQRINHLSFTLAPGRDGLYITAPANGNLAPPGHYMLFILNHAGVPSVAHMMQLCTPGPTCLTPPGPSNTPPVVALTAGNHNGSEWHSP